MRTKEAMMPAPEENPVLSGLETEGIRRIEGELKKEGLPVSFDVFYTAHLTAADVEGLREKIQRSDVFIPENVGWTKEMQGDFQEVADGKISPEDQIDNWGLDEKNYQWYGVLPEELRALYGTKARVVFVDIPEGHKLEEDFFDLPQLDEVLDGASAAEKLKNFDHFLREDSRFQAKREQMMMREIKRKMSALSRQEGRPLRATMFLGSLHSWVYHALSGAHADVQRSYREMPYVFDFIQEARRRYRFNKEVDNDLLAKGVVQWLAETFVLPVFKATFDFSGMEPGRMHREVIGLLGRDQIAEIIAEPSLASASKKLLEALTEKFKKIREAAEKR